MPYRTHRFRPLALAFAFALAACASAPDAADPRKLDAATERALLGPTSYLDAIVVLADRADAARLAGDLGRPVKTFRRLPMARVFLNAEEIADISRRPYVRYVAANRTLELLNAEGRVMTGAEQVQRDLGYRGEGIEVAVIDTGADETHADLVDPVRHNWQVVGDLVGATNGVYLSPTPDGTRLETDVTEQDLPLGAAANTDEFGHGTHVIGTIAGTGAASEDAHYRGMAPEATVDSYSVSAGIALIFVLEAYDHLIDRVASGEAKIRLVSNSWGTDGCAFDPLDPVNVATWTAYQAGILSVFAYGNEGAADATCNPYAAAPYVLGVGATDKNFELTGFSSRGIPTGNHSREAALAHVVAFYAASAEEQAGWDHAARPLGLMRPSLVAPGQDIVSAQNPAHPMTLSGGAYGAASGTSMATPHVTGVLALVLEAYEKAHGQALAPIGAIRLLEATASRERMVGYAPHEVGTGFVDGLAAVQRAASGDIPERGDDELPRKERPRNVRLVTEAISGVVLANSWETDAGYATHKISVEEGAFSLKATVRWASASDKVYLRLWRPGADPAVDEPDATSAGLLDTVAERWVEVADPVSGTWVLRVDGRVNAGATEYEGTTDVAYPGNEAPTASLVVTPDRVRAGDKVGLRATVVDTDGHEDLTQVVVLLRDGRGRIQATWTREAFTVADETTLQLALSDLEPAGPAPWTFELMVTDSQGHNYFAQAFVSRR